MKKTNLTHRKTNHSHSAKEATIIVMTNFRKVLTTTFMIGNPLIGSLTKREPKNLVEALNNKIASGATFTQRLFIGGIIKSSKGRIYSPLYWFVL
jgi:hypothetical protein